jgi:CBS domain containing-hemolysin-like protein
VLVAIHSVAVGLAFLAITFLHVVFGELIPKTLALQKPDGTALWRRGAHTRMPVYDGELDNIVGIVNTKDLFYLFSLKGVVILEDALYPPLFLKCDEDVANAFQLFRKARRPMALVRDAEGRILGLITLEDVLEEIVGDIEDEHDRPSPKLARHRRRQRLKPEASSVERDGGFPRR